MVHCETVCSSPCGVGYGYGGIGYGYGGIGSCGLVPAYGVGGALSGVGYGVGGALSGVGYGPYSCSTQAAGSEVVVQPPASVLSLPGPILSSTGEATVVSFNPCSGYGYPALGASGGFSGGSLSGGYGRLGYGYGSGCYGGYGGWRRYSRRYSTGSCGPC